MVRNANTLSIPGDYHNSVTSLDWVFRDDPPALELRGLTKRYDDGTLALEDFNLEIHSGAFFGLLGPNGAGKTTLISAVCNLLRVTEGEVLVFGAAARHAAGALVGRASPSRTSTSTAS